MKDKEESILPIRDDQHLEASVQPEAQPAQNRTPIRFQMDVPEGNQNAEASGLESPHDQSLVLPRQIEIHPTYWKKILSQHRKWVKSGGKSGERANLSDAHLEGWNFEGVDLPQAILRNAHLRGSNFSEANLGEADLQGADLREVDFRRTSLQGADLHAANVGKAILKGADLRNANLTSVSGLLPRQLASADLTGSILPGHIRRFEGLIWIKELTGHAKMLFLVILSTSLYAWLAITKITDTHLVANSSVFIMPILKAEIPVVGFYWSVPLILLILYIYFHVSLQRLWKEVAELPSTFPDGKRLGEKTYPWLLNSFVRAKTLHSGGIRTPFSSMESLISIGLAWWMIPLLLVLFWGRYLTRHEWGLTFFHIVVLGLAIGFGISSYRLAKATLAGKEWPIFFFGRTLRNRETYKLGGVVVGIGAILWVLSYGAMNGAPHYFMLGPKSGSLGIFALGQDSSERQQRVVDVSSYLIEDSVPWKVLGEAAVLRFSGETRFSPIIKAGWIGSTAAIHDGNVGDGIQKWAPVVLASLGYIPFLDVRDQEISKKPIGWREGEKELTDVSGVDLKYRNLRYANMVGAFLIKADLRGADLQGADLTQANLQGATLNCVEIRCPNLKGIRLVEARLEKAHLQGVNLRATDLSKANLNLTDLRGANLQRTKLILANLIEAKLTGANLQQADLRGSLLQKANIEGGQLQQALLSKANLQGANLAKVDLRDANLFDTNCNGADFREANLTGVVLEGANLQQANMGETVGLTGEALRLAKNWVLAFYSAEELLLELGLPLDHNQKLNEKNLRRYDLSGANLRGADLREFDFRYAKLRHTDLRGANLTDAKNLRQRQINRACVDEQTQLPLTIRRPLPCAQKMLEST